MYSEKRKHITRSIEVNELIDELMSEKDRLMSELGKVESTLFKLITSIIKNSHILDNTDFVLSSINDAPFYIRVESFLYYYGVLTIHDVNFMHGSKDDFIEMFNPIKYYQCIYMYMNHFEDGMLSNVVEGLKKILNNTDIPLVIELNGECKNLPSIKHLSRYGKYVAKLENYHILDKL